MTEKPVLSLLRGFSAPVNLAVDLSEDDLIALFQRDSDPFNRWQAAQSFASLLIRRRMQRGDTALDGRFVAAVRTLVTDRDIDPAFAALALALPAEADLAREVGQDVDPDAIHSARSSIRRELSVLLGDDLAAALERLGARRDYAPDAKSAGLRAIRNGILDLGCASGTTQMIERAFAQYQAADNMTDRMAALQILGQHDTAEREAALADFAKRFADEPLILDKWFSTQAQIASPTTLDRVRTLMAHPAFALSNPNRVRSLVGAFAAGNPTQFNRKDGEGYAFVVDIVLKVDRANPQLAARLLGAFKSWRSLESIRRARAHSALSELAKTDGLSRDVTDIVQRAIA
jgi:aminopeptidase N